MNVDQERVTLQTVVNTTINKNVPYNAQNFLTS
jgi:hypothetical protein